MRNEPPFSCPQCGDTGVGGEPCLRCKTRVNVITPRLLLSIGALALASLALGCEPIYVGVVAVAGASAAEPGSRGLVLVREPGGPGARQLAHVVVSAKGHVVTPLGSVLLSCEPRETCATHGDLIQLLTPSPDLPYFDIKVEKAGFKPEHVRIDVARAREVPWRQVFVVLTPRTDGVDP